MSLVERALDLIAERGGQIAADVLARELVGASGPHWTAILATSLNDPRLVREGDFWCLSRPSATTSRFAFAIETTGQDAATHDIVSIAACKVGTNLATFQTLVRPERRLPQWLVERLAIDPALVDEAPTLQAAIGEFQAFVGDSILVGYDAHRWIAFLNYRLRWIGLPPIRNQVHDLLPEVADRLGATKPGVERVARTLGIPIGRRHYGANEARLIAAVASKLEATPLQPTSDRDPILGAAGSAPDRPGIYRFLDASGETLYVGKAKSLRRRLRSYLARPAEHERALAGLRTLTDSVQIEELPDELAALLREAELVETLRPRFNAQRQVRRAAVYLSLDRSEPFPRIRKRRDPGPDQFGPFPSDRAARQLAERAAATFPLRVCTRKIDQSVKRRRPPCELLEAGRCLGPCTGSVDPRVYAQVVAEASAFLAGDQTSAINALRNGIRAAAAQGDHAEVNRQRDLLRDLIATSPVELLGRPYDPANVAVYLPGGDPPQVYLIVGGSFCFSGTSDLLAELGADALTLQRSVPGATLIGRWLRSNQGRAMVIPLSPADSGEALVRRVLDALAPPWFGDQVEPKGGRITV